MINLFHSDSSAAVVHVRPLRGSRIEVRRPPTAGSARAEVTPRDMDVAFALQDRFQEVAFHSRSELHRLAPSPNQAMAGGCALNSVANGMLFDRTPFERTWIQPAACRPSAATRTPSTLT